MTRQIDGWSDMAGKYAFDLVSARKGRCYNELVHRTWESNESNTTSPDLQNRVSDRNSGVDTFLRMAVFTWSMDHSALH